MKRTSLVFLTVFVLLAILHQDFWNWDTASLVFGFMPMGLASHALYTLVATAFWAVVIKVAWPTKLEEWAEGGEE